MKNVINEHLPSIWEMTHNRSVCSPVVSRRESLKSTEHIMLDMAHDYGYCHIALIRKGVEYINVFSELPDYILVKSREFKKDLERIIVKDINGLQVPFAVYTAVDGNIKEGSSFIWLKRSQIRPTRVLTIKY
jgi:hypothetical protein